MCYHIAPTHHAWSAVPRLFVFMLKTLHYHHIMAIFVRQTDESKKYKTD